ncbi:MAG: YggW family oxidoreductase [Hydrogenophilales bacterium CG_4_9_14_3_um_filter_59_35]|nr:MAG: YggW family oxidoreductase [Hydrogenophilales bacterium CG18_big_fil_WC_8_21_14_2_50_58_12]PIY02019.1 MAG: YggW family oxidoreductase [Hydrogenophilales bacterium CG_4_10_14_3_um_filter_58_23]PJB06649.1 MAG: YggW family oxidoreductase [Hydrogenophilales bacterium CG_4_9_14_3_um_filter_59_35]
MNGRSGLPAANQRIAAGRPLLQSAPPLSLYIHLPWCVRKCPYCDFSSFESREGVPEEAYVAALLKDLEAALPLVWGRKVVSIFMGGGTPSLFSARAIDTLLTQVRALLPVEAHAEITLEANPGTAEAQKFADFRAAGVNRLSLGTQSFNPRHLRALGRIHDDREARFAVELALRHFDNVNLDLMYALPEQTLEEALADIREAVSFGPQHISAYHLTLEPNTVFYSQPPILPDDDMSAAMQEAIEAELAGAGYEHYETSAFAKKHSRCRHNLNYWLFGDYLGIGAGAHGKLTFHDRILRQVRHRQPKAYMERALAGNALEEERTVSPDEMPFEFMMNALRLTEGFPTSLFPARTGLSLTAALPMLEEAQRRGLIERDALHIRPTLLGQRFLNELLQLFLAE